MLFGPDSTTTISVSARPWAAAGSPPASIATASPAANTKLFPMRCAPVEIWVSPPTHGRPQGACLSEASSGRGFAVRAMSLLPTESANATLAAGTCPFRAHSKGRADQLQLLGQGRQGGV